MAAMQITCGHCSRALEYSGDQPRFCAYCGKALQGVSDVTALFTPAPGGPTPCSVVPSEEITAAASSSGSPTIEEMPELIGGYRLLRRLGGGGMGSVYEAEESASGRRVALKLILPDHARTPEAVLRFRQEGQLASALAHPRCVFVYATDEDGGRPYIVMELMPGSTLDDLIHERGPLSIEEAVTKILDVIDGLSEAHRLGLVHRDVKPSNCFLEADGHVKVGDFGLAKSLVADAGLTRTGTFLGTPLYAAPEQIKREQVDAQSDVYSVAATLYFLLTGRAPHQTGDTMATLARIVSDDPPPPRTLRPDLPRGLDRLILRGLERDRRRRIRDLDEFRTALVSFLPARPSVGGLGLRFVAFVIDFVLLFPVKIATNWALTLLLVALFGRSTMNTLFNPLFSGAVSLLYFGILEGVWGCSVGKWLLRLRVGRVESNQPPGVARAMLRYVPLIMVYSGNLALPIFAWWYDMPLDGGHALTPKQAEGMALFGIFNGLWMLLMLALLVMPMRRRNGYRGLHEMLSGTRTYLLTWPRRQRLALGQREFRLEVTHPDDMPERLGPYRILGALRWAGRQRTLLAQDELLGRQLWIWVRSVSEPPLDAARRALSRATRVRWVGAGVEGPWQWDAFLAPAGVPLPALAAGPRRLRWTEVRPILEDLTEELAAACADGTLPNVLTPHQLWVQADGRIMLLGTPLEGSDDEVAVQGDEPESAESDDMEARALDFLRRVTIVALEGAPRTPAAAPGPIHAPLPIHVEELLGRLSGAGAPYASLAEWRHELEATRERPTEVTRLRRAGHLALTTLLLHIPIGGPSALLLGLLAMLLASSQDMAEADRPEVLAVGLSYIGVHVGFWVIWAFIFRGGYAFWRGGLALRCADGSLPARWRCALRALLVWTPVAGLLALAVVISSLAPAWPRLPFGLLALAALLLPLYAVLAILMPRRGLHDRLAGTYLVPE